MLLSAALVSLCGVAVAGGPEWDARRSPPTRVLPAEFERQDAVLITWDANDEGMQQALVDVIGSAWSDVNFYILVPNVTAEGQAMRALRAVGVPRRAVKFLAVPTDSVWTRDFGPQVVLQRDGSSQMVDCDYGHGDRVGDDLVPAAIAPNLGMRTLRPPITADGGNIQTNGRGLALTTTSILDHNADRGYTSDQVAKVFRDYYGVSDLVFLEPLEGESTGHVDMFAVFVSPDTVLVGQYDREQDAVNADLLDRNAARLERVRGPDGPLRVIRIPMPPRDEKVWRTYTNVLFANGTLLVPKYPGIDPQGHAAAVMAYRRLLPKWRVVGIDCSRLIEWGGALHCMTMNLARVPAQEDDVTQVIGHTPPKPSAPNDLQPLPAMGRERISNEESSSDEEVRDDDSQGIARRNTIRRFDDRGSIRDDDRFELPTVPTPTRIRPELPARSNAGGSEWSHRRDERWTPSRRQPLRADPTRGDSRRSFGSDIRPTVEIEAEETRTAELDGERSSGSEGVSRTMFVPDGGSASDASSTAVRPFRSSRGRP